MAETLPPSSGEANASIAPGARLSAARHAQNLAATDVARQLKLSVWQVEALEEGRYQQLPGPIFVRGFIRNYARLLKLDPEELLRAAGDTLPQQSAKPETPPSRDIPFPTTHAPRWPRFAAAAAVIFCALAVYEFIWNEPEGAATRAVSVTPPLPMAAQQPAAPALTPTPSTAQEASELRPAEPAIVAAATMEPALPAVAGDSASAAPSAERAPRPGEKRVKLDFDRESWVEIRDRNERVIFSQLNPPGTSQQVSGLPPLSIVVGNAHGVRMTFADQPVDLASYTKIDVARMILE